MFDYIDFETVSTCNRHCPTCIRNSHPDRKAVQSWFEPTYLPIKIIRKALDQCTRIGFSGGVCLSHYNEPLLDERIVEIGRLVKSYGQFSRVFFNTNGDFITDELARELDGSVDRIIVSLYMKEPIKSQRVKWIESLFHKTEIYTITQSDHIATHFSPAFDVKALSDTNKYLSCKDEPQTRVIINHRRQYLLCCDDVIGNFGLGTFPETSIEDFWFGEKRMKIISDLENSGGRLKYAYCSTCPRS